MTQIVENRPLSVPGLAVAGGVALVVVFVVCALVELAVPGIRATHAWVGLLTLAPVTSPLAWLEGIVFSLAAGLIAGSVVGWIHNAIAARGL